MKALIILVLLISPLTSFCTGPSLNTEKPESTKDLTKKEKSKAQKEIESTVTTYFNAYKKGSMELLSRSVTPSFIQAMGGTAKASETLQSIQKNYANEKIDTIEVKIKKSNYALARYKAASENEMKDEWFVLEHTPSSGWKIARILSH